MYTNTHARGKRRRRRKGRRRQGDVEW